MIDEPTETVGASSPTADGAALSFGDRLMRIRHLLCQMPAPGEYVKYSAMDRATGLKPGWWRILERERVLQPYHREDVEAAMEALAGALSVSTTGMQLLTYAEGKTDVLPFPIGTTGGRIAWRHGKNPNLKTGRGANVRDAEPRVRRTRAELEAQDSPQPAAAPPARVVQQPPRFQDPGTALAESVKGTLRLLFEEVRAGLPTESAVRLAMSAIVGSAAAAGIAVVATPGFWELLKGP